jgi:ligand-binding SRPBCC domain-containing protein
MYTLETKLLINTTIETAWNFFSSPANLQKITPGYMGFEILSNIEGQKMFPGMIISYIVKPLLGFPLKWVTEITHVKEYEYFVDEQRVGPYKIWHHLHRFKKTESGVLMEDILHYSLPFGFIGRIAHKLFVRKRVEEIFAYREKVITKLFLS